MYSSTTLHSATRTSKVVCSIVLIFELFRGKCGEKFAFIYIEYVCMYVCTASLC
jgi:hypothetical protein